MAESHNYLSTDGHSQQQSQHRSDQESNHPPLVTPASIHVVPWRVRDLKAHPSYAQLGVKIPASRLNEAVQQSFFAKRNPQISARSARAVYLCGDLVSQIPELTIGDVLHALLQNLNRRSARPDHTAANNALREFKVMNAE